MLISVQSPNLSRSPEPARQLVPTLVLVFSLIVTACASHPPTFEQVLSGDIPLADQERQAIERLLSDAEWPAARLPVIAAGKPLPIAPPFLRIEDGRVTAFSLGQLTSIEPVAAFMQARVLRLWGSFEEASIVGFENLELLQLRCFERELQRATIERLPALTEMIVIGGALDTLSLSGLPSLERLRIEEAGLTTPPKIDGTTRLVDLDLSDNRIASLSDLPDTVHLVQLTLSDNRIESLQSLPEAPNLQRLALDGNPLRPKDGLTGVTLPRLASIDLRRTVLRSLPSTLAPDPASVQVLRDGPDEAEQAFLATLERLRSSYRETAGERLLKAGSGAGRIRGRGGTCKTLSGTLHRADLTCSLKIDEVTGTARVVLAETDAAMPFGGGGIPRVRATLRVEKGQASVYLRERYDLIEIARTIHSDDIAKPRAEAERQPEDSFDGFRRVTASPGRPAIAEGEILLFGSAATILVEASGSEATAPTRGLSLDIESL